MIVIVNRISVSFMNYDCQSTTFSVRKQTFFSLVIKILNEQPEKVKKNSIQFNNYNRL